ncbi:hypothetical protein Trydic_g23649 [Trypoxylus dichotomus]
MEERKRSWKNHITIFGLVFAVPGYQSDRECVGYHEAPTPRKPGKTLSSYEGRSRKGRKLSATRVEGKEHSKAFGQREERESFLRRIIAGDEEWIYCDNPKSKLAWVKLREPG